MLQQAGRYQAKHGFSAGLAQADISSLPFADESFDHAISLATYHHLPSGRQAAAFAELYRVLRPSGEAFITVWNRRQPRFWWRGRETTVPWRSRGETLSRYYYLFSRRELAGRLRRAGFRLLPAPVQQLRGWRRRLFPPNICLLVVKD
jgi:SAM-dependent methyltransferase